MRSSFVEQVGQNFAIACEQYGEKDRISILHCLGGRNGQFIQQVLQDKGIHQICGMISY